MLNNPGRPAPEEVERHNVTYPPFSGVGALHALRESERPCSGATSSPAARPSNTSALKTRGGRASLQPT